MSKYSKLILKLLTNRGITKEDDIENFLNPSYEKDLHDPFLMLGMDKAVNRIFQAINKKEKIVIFGDYDCDGIPGSVILHDFFKKIQYKNFFTYIPDRHKEGYGLNKKAIEKFNDEKVNLIITVDLGINDIDQVALANKFNIDVIITDHHLPSKKFPKALVILNSKQEKDKYPFKELCGAGVVFKLVQALILKIKNYNLEIFWPEGQEKWFLDMVALATLSDRVPLLGENRAFAYYGLKVLQKNKRIGIKKLLEKMNINLNFINEEDIGFSIAPKLNAASRMDHPEKAFQLLSTDDEIIAEELVNYLTEANDERKKIVIQIMREINKDIKYREEDEIIVIGNPKWRIGVLGLIATRLAEDYKKPTFVWGLEGGDIIKGSCRSDGSVNLVEMMAEVPKDVLTEFGGHELAGGFSVAHEKIHLLEEEVIKAYQKTKKDIMTAKEVGFDTKMSLDEVTLENYKQIEKLAPFGQGNQRPSFLFENVEILGTKVFGKVKNHLELLFLNSSGKKIKAICFFKDQDSFKTHLASGEKINLIANIELSRWNGYNDFRLRIVDIV